MRIPLGSTTLAAAIAFAALAGAPASAVPINGSDTVGAGVASTNETAGNLGTTTQVSLSSTNETFSVLAVGAGSFSAIPINTNVLLAGSTLSFASAASFDFTSATVGDFTPTSIMVFNQTPTSINVFLTGTFTPGTLFGVGATAPLGASENIGLTQTNGGQISLSGTFASPPANSPLSTPEPLTLALFGAGLFGTAVIRRRKKA